MLLNLHNSDSAVKSAYIHLDCVAQVLHFLTRLQRVVENFEDNSRQFGTIRDNFNRFYAVFSRILPYCHGTFLVSSAVDKPRLARTRHGKFACLVVSYRVLCYTKYRGKKYCS